MESREVAPETSLVVPLKQVDEELSQAVGEKMARLAEISNKGLCRVPDGFVVSAYAFQRFLEAAAMNRVPGSRSAVGKPSTKLSWAGDRHSSKIGFAAPTFPRTSFGRNDGQWRA